MYNHQREKVLQTYNLNYYTQIHNMYVYNNYLCKNYIGIIRIYCKQINGISGISLSRVLLGDSESYHDN